MLDTLSLARELQDAGIEPRHADAITHVVQQAVDHGDPATRSDLDALRKEVRADIDALRAEVRADLAALEARLIKWIVGVAVTATGIIVAAGTAFVVAVLQALR